jgi:AraC family transcriptional regulator
MDAAVELAVEYIRECFSEPLTVADIAERARLGRFPLSRVFKEETGVSPGGFLAAVRIHEAKRLIDATSMSISEVSATVGYGSPDSFTDAFTAGVGLSPGRFRRLCRGTGQAPPGPEPGPGAQHGAVAGTVRLPEGHGNARVYLGAFGTAAVQYPAVAAAVVDVPGDRPSCYSLHNVPEGSWHLLAVAVAAEPGHDPRAGWTTLVGGHGAATVTVTAGGVVSAAVRLRPARSADPPILLALPELEPPATFVPHPGCAAASEGSAPVGRLRVVSPVPTPSGT